MPKYEYECKLCNMAVLIHHKVGEIPEACPQCHSENVLERVYSFSIGRTVEGKIGNLVKSHIEEAKKELRKEKKELSKKEFKL